MHVYNLAADFGIKLLIKVTVLLEYIDPLAKEKLIH